MQRYSSAVSPPRNVGKPRPETSDCFCAMLRKRMPTAAVANAVIAAILDAVVVRGPLVTGRAAGGMSRTNDSDEQQAENAHRPHCGILCD